MRLTDRPGAGKTSTSMVLVLEAEERYAHERYQFYRAKTYGPRATSPAQLRELERLWHFAETRLRRARAL